MTSRMTPRSLMLAALVAWAPLAVHAQHASAPADAGVRAPQEARQFDFLIGQWELNVIPKVNSLAARIHGVPKMSGLWKAWRAMDGWGIEDELRIVDASGNPKALSHVLRVYDAESKRWKNLGVDAYKGAVSQSTSAWDGTMMLVSGQGTDGDGKAYHSRVLFRDITPNSFTYRADRSYDLGKTWTEGVLTIEAKRSSAVAAR